MALSADGKSGGTQHPDVGTTPYQRMVETAAALMQTPVPLPTPAEVARLAGVPPEMAAEMFGSEHALCAAVAEDSIVRLGDFLTHRIAVIPLDDPAAQMRTMMLAYLDWAAVNILPSRMLVDHNLPAPCREVYRRYVVSMQTLWQSILGRAEQQGQLRAPMTPEAAELIGRSLVIGFGRILLGEDDDYMRDKDNAALQADMTEAVNLFCDMVFQNETV